jgi:hypothetical protein
MMRAPYALAPLLTMSLTMSLTLATSTAAQAVPDRYGPSRTDMRVASAQPPAGVYGGRMLTWASRTAPPPAPTVEAPQVTPPAPIAAAPAPAALQPPRAPASLYDSPPPVAQARPAPIAAAAPAQPRPQAPVRLAAAPNTAAGGAPTRYYSLHREYGLSPDPAPVLPSEPRYVLVGPPDAPASAKDAQADDTAGVSERPF